MTVFRDEHSLNNNIFTSTHYAEGFVVLKEEGVKLSIGERSSQLFNEWKIENGKWEIVYGQEKFVTLSIAKSLLNSDQVIKNFPLSNGEGRERVLPVGPELGGKLCYQ